MALATQIEAEIKTAMLARDSGTTDLLRLLKAAFQNEMISLKKPDLTDEEALKVLKREAKKREDSIELYLQGQRSDLADKEKIELAMIQKYLPVAMSEEAIKEITAEVIAELGSTSPSQFGLVMKTVMAKTGGAADGALVSKVVKELLK